MSDLWRMTAAQPPALGSYEEYKAGIINALRGTGSASLALDDVPRPCRSALTAALKEEPLTARWIPMPLLKLRAPAAPAPATPAGTQPVDIPETAHRGMVHDWGQPYVPGPDVRKWWADTANQAVRNVSQADAAAAAGPDVSHNSICAKLDAAAAAGPDATD